MWDSASEMIGKQRCTPLGYTLHRSAEQLGAFGFLLLIVLGGYLAWRGFSGTFRPSLFLLTAIPFAIGIIAEMLFQKSLRLAAEKGFSYDNEKREASWIEQGQRVTFSTLTEDDQDNSSA